MYIQRCVKGIAGDETDFTQLHAEAIMSERGGLISNWWRLAKGGSISPSEVEDVLTGQNLDRHVHDYDVYGCETPFISLACGSVERDAAAQTNVVYSAVDMALTFATRNGSCAGALFYLWVPVSHNRAVEIRTVAEPIRDLNIYRRWSPYQLEGEITAKICIAANQIEKVEWWEPDDLARPKAIWPNPYFVDPEPLSNIRDCF